jgi:predicted O-linked N-acetylglucosamine transferase (SPINDLY family)
MDFASAVQLHSAGRLDAATHKMKLCCKTGGNVAAQACFNAGVYLSESQNFAEASKYFRLSIEHDGRFALAYSNLGVTHQYLGDFAAALGSYESALKLSPKDATTYFNIGKVNQELGRTMDAIRSFEHSVRLKPDYFEAYATLGGAYTPLRDWERSASLLRDALKLQPDSVEGLYLLLYSEMQMCSWPQTTQLMRLIRALIAQRLLRDERPGMEAYASLTMPWTMIEQARIAASFSRAAARNVQHLPPLPKHDPALSKLRVAFKSYDFADHMSLYLIIEAMEMLAARRDIVSFAFNVRRDDGSELVRRLRAAFAERYFCVAELDSHTAAAKINERKPHIMVDLDGHFRNSRFAVLHVLRVAPCVTCASCFAPSRLSRASQLHSGLKFQLCDQRLTKCGASERARAPPVPRALTCSQLQLPHVRRARRRRLPAPHVRRPHRSAP